VLTTKAREEGGTLDSGTADLTFVLENDRMRIRTHFAMPGAGIGMLLPTASMRGRARL